MMMMIPEPWSNHESMDDDRRAFYQYHSCLMEPWDGPASIAFTDGRQIGAVLDRNGLRPSRYYVTKDDLVIMASEAGVLDVPPEQILHKGRLQPGRMFLVDTEQGRIIDDDEIKAKIASERPYRQWLDEHLVHLEDLPERAATCRRPTTRRCSSGRSRSATPTRTSASSSPPMARDGVEAVGSMGNDAAAGGALQQAAAALRLFQAALRPGHEPADRLHPRGDHHLGRDPPRLGGQPAASRSRPPAGASSSSGRS